MKKLISIALSLVVLIQPATVLALSTTTTTVGSWEITATDLGTLPGGTFSMAYAINDLGVIAGASGDGSFNFNRVLWDSNGNIIAELPNYDPSSTAIPSSINERGEVVGTENISSTLRKGVYWVNTNNTYSVFGLPGLNGGSQAQITARSINKNGWIAGSSRDGISGVTTAVLWERNSPATSLGVTGEAFGVTDVTGSPHAVGIYSSSTLSRGFLWRDGKLVDLGAVGGSNHSSRATAVSDSGYIAGTSDSDTIAVRWEYDNTNPSSSPSLIQLPTPSGLVLPSVSGVNSSGDVVGSALTSNFARSHAVLWRNGEGIDIGTWATGSSKAYGINAAGQIVGEADIDGSGRNHAILWTITPSDGTPPPPPPNTNTAPTVSNISVSATSLKVGGTINVLGDFSDPDNGPWTYVFDWGDGTITTGMAVTNVAVSASHTYIKRSPKKGYIITLTVQDAVGASDVITSANIKVSR